jgi:lipopolysaccharide transport system permease protein
METVQHHVVIEAGRAEKQYWRDLWRFRELLYFLAWRDILVRYKQTVVGVAWSLIRPFLTMIVFVIVFGRIAKLGSGPLLVMAGMLPWQFFSNALSESGNSLVTNTNLITKIYFPRMVVPASSVVTSLVDFAISCLLMAAMFAYYHAWPSSGWVLAPVFVLLAFVLALGVGLFAAALMAQYRDFRFILPFVTQFGIYVSPVGFASSHVPEKWRLFYSLNPMVGVIDGFRWSLLGGENALYWPGLALSICMTALLLAGGIWYFRRVERTMADVI